LIQEAIARRKRKEEEAKAKQKRKEDYEKKKKEEQEKLMDKAMGGHVLGGSSTSTSTWGWGGGASAGTSNSHASQSFAIAGSSTGKTWNCPTCTFIVSLTPYPISSSRFGTHDFRSTEYQFSNQLSNVRKENLLVILRRK